LRQASAIDFNGNGEHLDAADIRLEQLAELADALVEQASVVRSHYDELQRTLDEAPTEADLEPTVGGARPVEESSVKDTDYGAPGPQVHDSARLVVMDMAMSGSTREETKAYLRESLGIAGGEDVVDEVFDRTEAAAQEVAPRHRRLFTRRRD
jgi:hypothetical protein